MLSRLAILLFAIAVGSVAKALEDFRLPETVIPKHYSLQILTDLQNDFYYKGRVSIELFVASPTNEIVLHSKNLKIFENDTKLIEEDNSKESNFENDFSKQKGKSLKLGEIDEDVEKLLDETKFTEKKIQEHKSMMESRVVVPSKKTNSTDNLITQSHKEQIHTNQVSEPPFIFVAGNPQENPATSQPQIQNFTSNQMENQQQNLQKFTTSFKLTSTTDDFVKTTLKPSVTFYYNSTNFSKNTHKTTSPSSSHHTQENTFKKSSSSFPPYSTTTAFPKITNKPISTFSSEFTYKIKNTSKPTPATFTFTLGNDFSKSTQKLETNPVSIPLKSTYPTKEIYKPTTTYSNKYQTEMEKTSPEPSGGFTEVSNYNSHTPSTFNKSTLEIMPSTTDKFKETMNNIFIPEIFICKKHDYNLTNNFLILHFDKPLKPGKKYKLYLNYEGALTDTLVGFHRVPYSKKNSRKSSWLASTVFEPNEARSAFPCFDEPVYKATFDITLGHEKKFRALSNMPLKSTSPIENKPDWQWSIFETTPKMSTYLVAFFISDFEYLTPRQNQTKDGSDVKYRFWARHDVIHKTRYAMRIAPEMKNYLENLLGVRDVLPKHDFVAVPSFVSSALENWGLIAFSEKNLLFTPGFSSIFSKFEITQVVGHEIAHMWFGNMVTPKWWDQIWLSEGFSNFFEILAVDHVQPNWDIKTVSAIFSYLKLFSLDAFESSHPLIPKFSDPNDLNDIFDSISYQKGFFLIRMLNYSLGQEAFLNGVRKYLKTNLLSNADDNDLWEALNDHAREESFLPSGIDLKDVMHSWTRQTGYPIVEIIRDYENNTASVTQQRFIRTKGDFEFRENYQLEETRWWIPITYTTGSELNFENYKPKIWLNPSDAITTITDMPNSDDFILLNLDASGLYRVNYDERNWALLISYLLSENYSRISVINRVQILDDLLDLARAGKISYDKALDATSYLSRERHFLPWKAAFSNFDFISRMFRSTETNKIFKKFLRNLIAPRFEELGFDSVKNESISDGFNRKQIVKWACKTGVRQCARKSVAIFKKWMEEKKPDENNPIPGSLRSVVYCTAIENGGAREWQFLWQRYLNIGLTDKTAVLYGLGCTKNTRTLKRYLDSSIKVSSGIRKQDAPTIFKAVARNEAGFEVAKYFLKENMKNLRLYLGDNSFLLPQMIDTMASKMNQNIDLEELEEIEQENYSNYRSAPKSFRQAIERVKFNIDWVEKNYQIITNWLKKQKI